MDDDAENGDAPVFDPVKLEQVDVNKDYPMEPDEFEILYKHNCYCFMAHISKYGYPIVTPMFYVVLEDGFVYISSVQKYRHKIDQLIANPKISVSICNDGSNAKCQKSIQIIGKAEISFDQKLLTEVHWAIIDKYWFDLKDNEEMRQAAFKGIHTPNRAIIKVIPNKNSPTSWDFGKMVNAYERGVWFNEAYQMSSPHDIR
ncbi:MAG: pyridoxamine 5'-phosphate oxidase family protein [Proteobacteria bacterium]|nr:pyridoxamine 5'-phosphate oxidase family protein [Pseudomonadota bacterium]